jgi:cytochrome c peroxidase
MQPGDRDAVNWVVANMGRAFAAYVRRIAAGPSPLDAFLQGDAQALSPAAQHGLRVFLRIDCQGCHSGPNFSDEDFHNLGVPAAPGAELDYGRATGLRIVAADPFNSHGPYATEVYQIDASAAAAPAYEGAFKTPSLRNLAQSAPYGHNGAVPTLAAMLDFHLVGGGQQNRGYVGQVDARLQPITLTPQDRDDLLEFLGSLNGTYRGDRRTPPYWWNWPDR